MKYIFITVLHYMKLDSIKNKGIQIYPGARVSNGEKVLLKSIRTDLMDETAGFHSIHEFQDATYFYIEGNFEGVNTQEQLDKIALPKTFFFLRQAQLFIHSLWKIKDNSIYVRDGFLIVYNENPDIDGFTYKASLSEINSYSNGEMKDTLFNDDEIARALQKFSPYSEEDFEEDSIGGKYPDHDVFIKTKGSTRLRRAIYHIGKARTAAITPMKITFYCAALECLFTTTKTELSHRISERVALLLGDSAESKKHLYDLTKKAYNTRSQVMHGESFSKEKEVKALADISQGLDDILRRILMDEDTNNIFSMKDSEIEEYFTDLLFQK